MTPPIKPRVRIRFAKFGPIRFTSHRDVARVWERSLRRGRIPVAYSEGFSPRPRLRFGLALATSHESCGEYLDIDLKPDTTIDIDGLPALIDPMLPPGMTIQATAAVTPGSPSLQESVESCTWLVDVPGLARARADEIVDFALTAQELPVTRIRKGNEVEDDVRPAVISLRVADPDERPPAATWQPGGTLLLAELRTQPRACRPAELLAAVDPTLEEGRVVRLHQWTKVDGIRCEPIPLGDEGIARPSAAHAQMRAS